VTVGFTFIKLYHSIRDNSVAWRGIGKRDLNASALFSHSTSQVLQLVEFHLVYFQFETCWFR
ncbi:hypothetical protein, partial [Klebsiella pneumoniae]|uniref:hypothetical protein n=1 Tax=Klebsiella pneumoniae TaxID=573 RepID=UPI0040556876